jgi:glycosyltransferase involved in cell wall biosynthesis
MQSNPKYSTDIEWMSSFGHPMLALETELMTGADAIRANSKAIIREIESAYDFVFDPDRTIAIPHGTSESAFNSVNRSSDDIEVLFVGRLEARKGIDVLLTAIPNVLSTYGNVRFKIIGDDTLPGSDGVPYADGFNNQYQGAAWLPRVHFAGKVTDQVLQQAYSECDIFVAPSRFESFGLVFLEAMRVAKPVISCKAGAMPEVISDGETGLLVCPGSAPELATALAWMIDHPKERVHMGLAGRRIFETRFTSAKMAELSLGLYNLVAQRHHNVA